MTDSDELKGGVILIGSLFWEDENNAIDERENRELARLRKQWREVNLETDRKEIQRLPLPIRYGRCSASRRCTYTMVLGRLPEDKESFGLVIPYKNLFDFSDYTHFEEQARQLAEVEGISKNGDKRLRKTWGCIGIYIKPDSVHTVLLKQHWAKLRSTDSNYNKSPNHYVPGPPLLDSDYCLERNIQINREIDFLFFTYIKVEHRELDKDGKPMRVYPTSIKIAEEINRSGYSTYFEENRKNGIETFQDDEIAQLLK